MTTFESQVTSLGQRPITQLSTADTQPSFAPQQAITQPSFAAPVTQQQMGMTEPFADAVTRPIHPVQPTFGMRPNQQLAGNAPTGAAVGNRGGRGGPDKGKKGRGGRGGGSGNRRGGPWNCG